MTVSILSRPEDQAQSAPPTAKDAAVTDALIALAKAQEAYKSGLFGAMLTHQRCAARALIGGYVGTPVEQAVAA